MNLNNILLLIFGVIGLGIWVLFIAVMSVMVLVRDRQDPVRLHWLAVANFMWLQLIFSIAAIGFSIYNWR